MDHLVSVKSFSTLERTVPERGMTDVKFLTCKPLKMKSPIDIQLKCQVNATASCIGLGLVEIQPKITLVF